MKKSRVIWGLHPFGWGFYLLNSFNFRLFPKFSFLHFAGLTKMGINWMGYILELQRDKGAKQRYK